MFHKRLLTPAASPLLINLIGGWSRVLCPLLDNTQPWYIHKESGKNELLSLPFPKSKNKRS